MMATLVECALRSAALIAIIWLALKVLRVRNPYLERSAWFAVLLAALAMPLLVQLPALFPASGPEVRLPMPLIAMVYPVTRTALNWQAVAFLAVALVSSILFLRQSIGIARWWNVRRLARHASLPLFSGSDIRVTSRLRSPATVFSTILVPADFESWPPQQQRAVIAHERTHVANRDFYVQWLAQLHRAIFWFNPLAWWLARRLSILSEHISDDAVIEQQTEPKAYAEMLLSFAQRGVRSEHVVSMLGRNSLATRIERILSSQKSGGINRRKALLLIGGLLPLIGGVAGFSAVSARSIARPNGSPDPYDPATLYPGGRIIKPHSDPARLSHPFYPSASRRFGEQGTVVMKLHVLEDGTIDDAAIASSSGHPDLDHAAIYEAMRWRVNPGTVDGVPARMWAQFAVTFKLSD
jgi:TonB family protein